MKHHSIRMTLCLATALGLLASAGVAQQPTQAQRDALRQSCSSDYQAHCSGVPTGGRPALNCLQSHLSELSPACQSAVSAAAGAPATTGSTAQPRSPAAQGASPAPHPPTRAEVRELRAECGPDFRTYCRGVEPGGGRALECLRENAARLSPPCRGALGQLGG